MVSKSRPSSKSDLSNNIFYIFSGLAQNDMAVDQEGLEMNWLKFLSSDVKDINAIPTANTFRSTEVGIRSESCSQKLDLGNLKQRASFISQHFELTLVVEHDEGVLKSTADFVIKLFLIETIS